MLVPREQSDSSCQISIHIHRQAALHTYDLLSTSLDIFTRKERTEQGRQVREIVQCMKKALS
jgi:hypothetical protein